MSSQIHLCWPGTGALGRTVGQAASEGGMRALTQGLPGGTGRSPNALPMCSRPAAKKAQALSASTSLTPWALASARRCGLGKYLRKKCGGRVQRILRQERPDSQS